MNIKKRFGLMWYMALTYILTASLISFLYTFVFGFIWGLIDQSSLNITLFTTTVLTPIGLFGFWHGMKYAASLVKKHSDTFDFSRFMHWGLALLITGYIAGMVYRYQSYVSGIDEMNSVWGYGLLLITGFITCILFYYRTHQLLGHK